jgi:sec-independent protein translocase protein TatC
MAVVIHGHFCKPLQIILLKMSTVVSGRKYFFKRISGRQEAVKEMSFLDHLEALRWHIVRSVIAWLAAAVTIFIFIDWIFDNIIYAPARENFITYPLLCNLGHTLHLGDALCMPPVKIPLLINTIGGSFTAAINICLMGGLIISFPFIFGELWKFIKPALSNKELKYARGSLVSVSLCFFAGGAFGYYLLAPFTFNFLATFKLGTMGAQTYLPSLEDYIDTLVNIILGCGLAFELPVLAFVLSKLGIITPALLKTYRKYAYIIILIVSAVITPSPDWTSQMIVGIPLLILYELSIHISAKVERQKA